MLSLTSLIAVLIANLHLIFNNWGFAILALALIVRFLLFPFQIFSFKQNKLLKKIQPEIDRLNSLHKENPLHLYRELGNLKKKEGIKTGLTLLSSMVQLPVFISIYRTFSTLQSFAGQSFLWLTSLGGADPLFILPLLMMASNYVQQKLNSQNAATANPQMQILTKLMPVLSFVFMMWLPSGLVLYYVASSSLQILGDVILQRMTS